MRRSQNRVRQEIGYRGTETRRSCNWATLISWRRRIQLSSRQAAFAAFASVLCVVLVLISYSVDIGGDSESVQSHDWSTTSVHLTSMNNSVTTDGTVSLMSHRVVAAGAGAAYAQFLSKSRFDDVSSRVHAVSPRLVEESSLAYVLTSIEPDDEIALEFAPGGECTLSRPAHWKACTPTPTPPRPRPKSSGSDAPSLLAATLQKTTWGEPAADFVNRVLRDAWGATPPRIDAVIRSGAYAADQTVMLLESLVLFWPRFLGDVVIVLDEADRAVRESIVPSRFALTLSLRVLYELAPCMPPRIWSQVGGLQFSFDHYSLF
jgi:hypothetical protein